VRLVFALPHVPWPPIGGGRARNWFLSSALARRHESHLFALQAPDEPAEEQPASLPYVSVQIVPVPSASPPRFSAAWATLRLRSLRHPAAAFYQPDAERQFARLVQRVRPDAIVYGMSWMLPYARAAQGVPGIVDEQNYDPQITARIAAGERGLAALKWRIYVAVTERAERRNLRLVQGIAPCSEEDAAIFRREAPHADVEVVPNGVDTEAITPQPLGDAVVMTGTFSYPPNLGGARWLAREVWPLVRRAAPAAELRFVGLRGEEVLRDLAALPGVTVVGAVPDMRPELALARVAVAPISVGGGTRIKILEAFAAGRPVVSTRIGAEGLAVTDGDTAFLRDEPAAFADAIVRLLHDQPLAEAMGARARALVVQRYDWRASAERLEALVQRVTR
jgi:glycosyltransferase involved in cell wall biosynthesis